MRKIKLSFGKRVFAWALVWIALLFVFTPIVTSDDFKLLVSSIIQPGTVTLEDEDVPLAGVSDPLIKYEGGAIVISYVNTTSSQIRAQFTCGSGKNNVVLKADGTKESFEAQHGSGTYTVQILKRVSPSENRYSTLYTTTLSVSIAGAPSTSSTTKATTPATYSGPYLGSSAEVNWNSGMACVKKAQELTAGKSSNSDKAKAIYNYLAGRLTYDVEIFRRQSLPAGYKPNPDNTFNSQSGICYDFSALFAAMCRSVGVPAKLCKGYADQVSGYHAWNQVDIDGSWITVDLSVDAQLRDFGKKYSMKKDDGKYRVTGSF